MTSRSIILHNLINDQFVFISTFVSKHNCGVNLCLSSNILQNLHSIRLLYTQRTSQVVSSTQYITLLSNNNQFLTESKGNSPSYSKTNKSCHP